MTSGKAKLRVLGKRWTGYGVKRSGFTLKKHIGCVIIVPQSDCDPRRRRMSDSDPKSANPQFGADQTTHPGSVSEASTVQSGNVAPHLERIGPYRILQRLGEGGMGTVYLAEQSEPVRRRVALKVIKAGMDSSDVIARFEAERQALAVMDHTGIAKVLDAGTTESGRPYFVMEYVKGVPLTQHCDSQRLSLEDRLQLFMHICEAAQHAHMKGVVHRDLKPSNILVTYEGDRAVPKIIDFGVAKALNQRLSEQTLYTELGQLIGTPEYMSPEQAEMSGQDIDTRADIYSLGVVLYELLVGALPFEPTELRAAAFNEIQRIIREVEPSKPSTRFMSLLTSEANTGSTIASSRRTEPRTWARRLRGDLDWIVMKCLEKDRVRRYESATAVAADLNRYLQNEPVEAGPPSAAYRFRKFARRNRTVLLAGSIIVPRYWLRPVSVFASRSWPSVNARRRWSR